MSDVNHQSAEAEGLLDEQPVVAKGTIPGPMTRMFAQNVSTAVVPVEGLGDCALMSFQAGNTTIDVLFPKASASAIGMQLVEMGSGLVISKGTARPVPKFRG